MQLEVRAIRKALEKLAKGKISVDEAEKLIRLNAIDEVGSIAKLDVGRESRKGIPEIVLAEGKRPEEVRRIVIHSLRNNDKVVVSRASPNLASFLKNRVGRGVACQAYDEAGILVFRRKGAASVRSGGRVGILTAGTSDIAVAEEAKVVAQEMGCEVLTTYDVGVAGIHRLFQPLREMLEHEVDVIIVVAGREGALPSVVAGTVDVPVIGIPTSVGYGLGEKGVGALTAMLQACSLGLAVVNIDGGVAGGAVAALIANRAANARAKKCPRHLSGLQSYAGD